MPPPIILAGPTGTRLMELGFDCDADRRWSARAVDEAPQLVAQIHREYAAAGADIHPAVTFRTTQPYVGDRWQELTGRAVQLCRESIEPGQRLAGVLAPLGDCYKPDAALTPLAARQAHTQTARELVKAGCELILCETFPGEEGVWAAESATAAGARETWVSFTPGPKGDLLTPQQLAALAERAAEPADAVLVNCLPAWRALEYVEAMAKAVRDRRKIGVYANVYGANAMSAEAYARLAAVWRDAGASVIGVCCGGGPAHVRCATDLL
jgi:S-methylmethionine-dependent homocysteine/selenocysteine methylase